MLGLALAGGASPLSVFGASASWSGGDRIVAVVEDSVILESELSQKVFDILRKLEQSGTPAPPEDVLRRQVLDRIISEKLQLQMAERVGIKVDDETLRQAVQQIASRNGMSLDQFRHALEAEGMSYADFTGQIRDEITLSRLRGNQVTSRIKVSDREIDNYLAAGGPTGGGSDGGSEFHLGHILIATPPRASSAQLQAAYERAMRVTMELQRGGDFKRAAVSYSNDSLALNGGDLGWRKAQDLPGQLAELVLQMREGEIKGPLRSPSGFHIIKLFGVKGSGDHTSTKTHVRHILLKTSEVLSDDDAKQRLLALRQRLEHGEDFATLARGHSDDKGSAIKGGDLGFVEPGALVPPFEEAMNKLAVNQLSEPVQSQFGWHLIQVLERQQQSDTSEFRRAQAREALVRRKSEEETELWLRQMRDEAYVEIRLDGAEAAE
ncbi:peptidylprolyl isomerase [Methylogaea oryzae]|uniref:peptidylprolyl isomerase n=1 Tax=Methylogaea oryzae TaxID=1295382 RepID=UPI0020D0DA55